MDVETHPKCIVKIQDYIYNYIGKRHGSLKLPYEQKF